MRTVWKYLAPFASHRGRAPLAPLSWDAKPVHCGLDPETQNVAVWVDCDNNPQVMGDRELFAFPTGSIVPDDWEHSLAANLDEEARALVGRAKGSTDDQKRQLLPRASACYGAAHLLRQIAGYRGNEGA